MIPLWHLITAVRLWPNLWIFGGVTVNRHLRDIVPRAFGSIVDEATPRVAVLGGLRWPATPALLLMWCGVPFGWSSRTLSLGADRIGTVSRCGPFCVYQEYPQVEER